MQSLASELFELLSKKNIKLVTAESCTGGLIAKTLTDMAGSSTIFERGFVTYSNLSKEQMLGVRSATLNEHGAVSSETACEMAAGAIIHSEADLSVSVTGIAGPDGGSETKPVGLVYIATCFRNNAPLAHEHHFTGTREEIRAQASKSALKHLIAQMDLT
jgi:nicotinamide-nucleotide amidase